MSHLIPEPSNFSEVTRLPEDVKKAWLKETLKEIKELTNNQNFIIHNITRTFQKSWLKATLKEIKI